RAGGHGTAEYELVQDFLGALQAGRKPPLDESRAMDLTVPGLIAHQSAQNGGNWLEVPLFG
ncbi:MAG: gfo/Idh/MocA family oxidoreductase, partial [Armatimonadetes bacterium]|nr:gfo/Idh/MocA family oxidoreductase [Armatimonadota bacterium]